MSSFRTHMLIGAVGGLGAYKAIETFAPATLSLRLNIAGSPFVVPHYLIGLGGIAISAYLALWPDIDEPGTHISRRAPHYMWELGALLGFTTAFALSRSLLIILIGAAIGALIGRISGLAILRTIRVVSGGHRRLTHSLVLGTIFLIIAAALYVGSLGALMWPFIALFWGQALHLVGDVVTPGGVPLFYPLSRYDYHMLPYPVARIGEPIIAIASILVGIALLTI